jgi:hypothetical protein
MYKKSINRIEKENEINQSELSNPALHDIIATNHVVLPKVTKNFIRKQKNIIFICRNHVKNDYHGHVKRLSS